MMINRNQTDVRNARSTLEDHLNDHAEQVALSSSCGKLLLFESLFECFA